MKELFNEIKNKKWFFGIRAEESLFFYSAKYLNREDLTNKHYQSGFVETLLFPIKDDYPVRVFNLAQAKSFHQESLDKVLNNPEIFLAFIKQDEELWKEIEKLSRNLKESIEANDYQQSIKLFQQLLDKYGQYGNLFSINFSLGKVMTENKNEFADDITAILQKHDQWRNSVALTEEKLGEIFYEFIKTVVEVQKINLEPVDIMKFLTVWEVLDYIQGNLDNKGLIKIIKARQKNGYVFSCLRNNKCRGAIDDKKTINLISQHFAEFLNKEAKTRVLKGTSTYVVEKKISGEVVVIKDKNELEEKKTDVKNKILVAIQTTPHFIPYLKGVKGIITDEGGVTCHAAIVSRELKIPCIVGTKNATLNLKDGNMVEMDTKNNTIKII
jgi:phosphohistidine swiveling domain-containing protein